jgi:hypothetical protein
MGKGWPSTSPARCANAASRSPIPAPKIGAWRIDLRNEAFPLWIGCGNYQEYDDGFLCFIEPSKRYVGWIKRVSTEATVEKLAAALVQIIVDSGMARDVRWWSDSEIARG